VCVCKLNTYYSLGHSMFIQMYVLRQKSGRRFHTAAQVHVLPIIPLNFLFLCVSVKAINSYIRAYHSLYNHYIMCIVCMYILGFSCSVSYKEKHLLRAYTKTKVPIRGVRSIRYPPSDLVRSSLIRIFRIIRSKYF